MISGPVSIAIPSFVLCEYVGHLLPCVTVLIFIFHMFDAVDRDSFAISNNSVILCSCLSFQITCAFSLAFFFRNQSLDFLDTHSPFSVFALPQSVLSSLGLSFFGLPVLFLPHRSIYRPSGPSSRYMRSRCCTACRLT